MPQALIEKPEVDLPTSWYLETFALLSGSRAVTQTGAGGIPLSEIINYGVTFGTIEDDLKTFCIIICEMDDLYLDHLSKKQKSNPRGASRK